LITTVQFSMWRTAGLCVLVCAATTTVAAVLPEDRGDLMYHSFSGGDVTVDGPSLLVRKKIGEQVSISGNYYVDMVTSASVDVKYSGASEYQEERTQGSLSVDYLRGKTTYNLAYIDSKESDYQAKTASIGISEDMFGDLTTVSLGYTRAWDKVFRNVKQPNGELINDPNYDSPGVSFKRVDHRSYRLGLSQVITKHLILGLNFETQTHEGQLGNPYRSIRHLNLAGTDIQPAFEKLPATRTNNAAALSARYFMPYRATVHGSYRFFTDTWGITAKTAELGYIHPWREWTFEGSYRHHSQEAASFYGDLFPRPDFQNFQARDRNLATLNSATIHVGVSYDLTRIESWTRSWLDKGSINLFFDYVSIKFDDFRDGTKSQLQYTPPSELALEGAEPMYFENANVIRFFISVWF